MPVRHMLDGLSRDGCAARGQLHIQPWPVVTRGASALVSSLHTQLCLPPPLPLQEVDEWFDAVVKSPLLRPYKDKLLPCAGATLHRWNDKVRLSIACSPTHYTGCIGVHIYLG